MSTPFDHTSETRWHGSRLCAHGFICGTVILSDAVVHYVSDDRPIPSFAVDCVLTLPNYIVVLSIVCFIRQVSITVKDAAAILKTNPFGAVLSAFPR